MHCPYCQNEIKQIEKCPRCKGDMIFMPGEGPTGTWECCKCKIQETRNKDVFTSIAGFRTTPMGLIQVKDLVGRYAPKKT